MLNSPMSDEGKRTMMNNRFRMSVRSSMPTAGSRICTVAISVVTAAAMLLASSAITATATTSSSGSYGLVGATAYSDAPRNFVINLGTTTNPLKSGQFEHAVSLVQTLGAVPLARYPQIGVLFAQSTSADFARELANQLTAAGIPFHSVAASRSTDTVKKDGSDIVQGSEIVVPSATKLSGGTGGSEDEVSPDASKQQGETATPDGINQIPANRMTIDAKAGSGVDANVINENTEISGSLTTDPDVGETSDTAWGIKATHADTAYTSAVSTISRTVTVGILDSGIDDTHPDLNANIDSADSAGCANNGIVKTTRDSWVNYKTSSGSYKNISNDQIVAWSHATHVAGIVGASHNGSGTQGIDPNVKLASVRVADSTGNIWAEYVVCGVMWSASKHFAVTNNSYNGFVNISDVQGAAQYEALRRAFAYAQTQNVVNVAAAGNNGINLDAVASVGWRSIPGDFPGVITVSNSELAGDNALGQLKRYVGDQASNYGAQHIDITAPGTSILSTCPKAYFSSDTCSMTGTSMAVPHVVGVVAILRSIFPKATVAGITSILKSEAKTDYGRLQTPNPSSEEYRGAGLANALAALGSNTLSVSDTTTRVPVYRLYNPYSKFGLHHQTTSVQERDKLTSLGWKLDGTIFVAVSKNSTNAVPVYREYNPNNGTHNWTLDIKEHQALVKLGWRNEGIAWYVRDDGQVPVWRLYNPYSGEHIYTRSIQEYATLKNNVGWHGEGLAWLGVN